MSDKGACGKNFRRSSNLQWRRAKSCLHCDRNSAGHSDDGPRTRTELSKDIEKDFFFFSQGSDPP